ncbi:mandelate racemase [Candidatus Poribacteria bacterium]|nr:mandelate racemase [Candidatus Poribacteria bacterium]
MATGEQLDDHRLAKVEARTIRDRFPRFVGRNANGAPSGRGASYKIRILTTDRGATGWAMSWWPDEKVPDLVGRKLSDLFTVEHGPADDAITLELPLYDLAANVLGLPVYEMLGAQGPTRVPIYSGAIYFDDLEPEDAPRGVAGVVASCRQDYDLGYRAFKLKIGRGHKWIPGEPGWRRDVEVTRAVREEFPDCRVLVDANDAYTPDGFIDYMRQVADCDLYWIEEPFTEDADDLRRLRDVMAEVDCRALIAEGEGRTANRDPAGPYGGYTQEHIDHLYALAEAGLVDVFLLDLGIVGYSRYRKIMPQLHAAGVVASPHTWVWTPRSYYTAQLAAGVGNVVIVEGIPGGGEGVDYSAYAFDDGDLVLPSTPGFGLRLEV